MWTVENFVNYDATLFLPALNSLPSYYRLFIDYHCFILRCPTVESVEEPHCSDQRLCVDKYVRNPGPVRNSYASE